MGYFTVKPDIFLLTALICFISLVNSNDKTFNSKFGTKYSDVTQASVVLTLLNNSKNLLEDAMHFAALRTSCNFPDYSDVKPMDCSVILEANSDAQSGIYRIWPRSRLIERSIEVYCDMDDDGGAWTVIQRRGDFDSGEDFFYKPWDDYKHGFGDMHKDFWLGNDKIFALTNQRSNTVKFELTDWEGNKTYATYCDFWIDDEDRKYLLHVGGYQGTAGDSFSAHSNIPFSTKDRDNDNVSTDCSNYHKSSWWHNTCIYSSLNGLYLKGGQIRHNGIIWYHLRNNYYSLKDTVIKIRPKLFKNEDGSHTQ